MTYKKKLKIFVILFQFVILAFVSTTTYFNYDSYEKTKYSFSEFKDSVHVEKKVYDSTVTLKLDHVENSTINPSNTKVYMYSFTQAMVDKELIGISGYDLYKSDVELEKLTMPVQLEGWKVEVPFNIYSTVSNDVLSLFTKTSNFKGMSTILVDTQITIHDENEVFSHYSNPKNEKELFDGLYEIYESKFEAHYNFSKLQQIMFTVLTGIAAFIVFVIFYILFFRKVFR